MSKIKKIKLGENTYEIYDETAARQDDLDALAAIVDENKNYTDDRLKVLNTTLTQDIFNSLYE